jgi:hypothetical protein
MMGIFYLYDPKTIDFHLDTGEHIYLPAGHDQFIEPGVLNTECSCAAPSWCMWLVPGYWRDDL